MAATSLSKRYVFKLSKSLLIEHPSYPVQSLLSFSTAYERAQDSRNGAPIDDTREHERDATIDNMSGVTGFVADAARHGAEKSAEVAEEMINLAKETLDNAYDSSKRTTRMVSETLVAQADDNVVDTSEYRSIEDQSGLTIMLMTSRKIERAFYFAAIYENQCNTYVLCVFLLGK